MYRWPRSRLSWRETRRTYLAQQGRAPAAGATLGSACGPAVSAGEASAIALRCAWHRQWVGDQIFMIRSRPPASAPHSGDRDRPSH
jgi:hypothetical protein